MSRSPSFAGIILAAGQSSRMGRDKALLPWQGGTFLGAAIDRLNACAELVVVVAGGNASSIAHVVYAKSAFLVENPDPSRGQFSSLQTGLQEVLNRGRDAAIITLVDRPPASPATFSLLREWFEKQYADQTWAVVPEYQGSHGHPIVFGREMIERCLRTPQTTTTAREIEHANQDKILYVPVDDVFVTMNVDTPEDFSKLQSTQQSGAQV